MLIGISDNETNGTASRLTLKHTAEQLHLVLLLTAGGDMTLSGAPSGQLLLDEVYIHQNTCRHSVNNASYGFTMTFAKGRQPEYLSESIHCFCLFLILLVAVSAATSFMVIMSAVAVAITIAFAVMVVVAATSTTARHMGHQVLYFFGSSFAVFQHSSFEGEILASQRMIQVHLNLLFADFDNTSEETLSLFVLQGNDSVFIDMFVVEMAVDAEHLAVQVEHELVIVVTIGLVLRDSLFCWAHCKE